MQKWYSLMTELGGGGAHGCLDPGRKFERQDSGLGAQKKPGQEAWMGSQPGPLWALYPNMEGFFGLHLSHPGHGPRDLLSRYCRQG